MGIQNIEKWSFKYTFLKCISCFWHNRVFYKKVIILNRESIPKNEHLIFAIVHQNALMDALAVLYNLKGQPVFLARSDIFRKPFVAKILYDMKILPIYRIRDGISNLKQNDAIFNKTIDVIKNKNGLFILPEGFHEGARRLKPLKKGIARIAFQADEASDFTLRIKLIPVGLDYSDYMNIQSTLIINFGEKIELSDFYDLYRENPAKGMNALLEKLSEKMKELIVNIENREHYKLINELREIYKFRMAEHLSHKPKRQPEKFFADQKLVKILENIYKENPEKIRELDSKVTQYARGVKKMKFRYWIFEKKIHPLPILFLKSIFFILFSPVYLWGLIHNYLPYKIPVLLVKPIKDVQFHSSFKFVISFVLFILYYLIIFVVLLLVINPLWIKLLYIISIPLSGIFAFKYYIMAKKTIAMWRYNFMVWRKDNRILKLRDLFHEIAGAMDDLLEPFLA